MFTLMYQDFCQREFIFIFMNFTHVSMNINFFAGTGRSLHMAGKLLVVAFMLLPASCCLPTADCQLLPASCCRPAAAGQLLPASHRLPVAVLATVCRLLVEGCCLPAAACRVLPDSCWLVAAS
jgi:hypothetical protein